MPSGRTPRTLAVPQAEESDPKRPKMSASLANTVRPGCVVRFVFRVNVTNLERDWSGKFAVWLLLAS